MAVRVLVFGTFDLLHAGHFDFLTQAKALGDELHVVIARDKTVQKVKGHLPDQNELTRQLQVSELPMVKAAHLGNLDDKYKIIEDVRPDIIALGYDQEAFTDALPKELEKRGLKPRIVRLQAYRPDIYKTSKIRAGSSVDKPSRLVL